MCTVVLFCKESLFMLQDKLKDMFGIRLRTLYIYPFVLYFLQHLLTKV